MKLIIQIPCFNEEPTLAITLAALPRQLPGIDTIEWLVIDDGSTDATIAVARENGADHVVSLLGNRGLAAAFRAGLEAAVELGADIIVNTDADNQYCADDIPKLIEPILAGRAEFVVGARPITEVEHFSRTKKILQRLGSWVVQVASGTDIPDAPSGFRAMTREVAMRLKVYSNYTYTLETIIQAGQKGMAIAWVPIRVNSYLRPSRLMKSTASYVKSSILTVARIFVIYRPLRFFIVFASLALAAGAAIWLRFLYFFFSGGEAGKVQSLLLGSVLIGLAFLLGMLGLMADLVSVNRRILEETEWRLRKLENELANDRRSKLQHAPNLASGAENLHS